MGGLLPKKFRSEIATPRTVQIYQVVFRILGGKDGMFGHRKASSPPNPPSSRLNPTCTSITSIDANPDTRGHNNTGGGARDVSCVH